MAAISPKKILADWGVDISRVSPPAHTLGQTPRNTQGWLVEFVGPSGVGKSTLWRQIAPMLQKDWFFEHHAKGLLGRLPVPPLNAMYLNNICTARLQRLMSLDMPLERFASIGQRLFEVTRLGLISKTPDIPRGFVMDDGIAHFFAEQILEQDHDATKAFFKRTAFVFLLPDGMDKATPELKVYYRLKDLVEQLGCPTLTLERNNQSENPKQAISFIQHGFLRQKTGTSAD